MQSYVKMYLYPYHFDRFLKGESFEGHGNKLTNILVSVPKELIADVEYREAWDEDADNLDEVLYTCRGALETDTKTI